MSNWWELEKGSFEFSCLSENIIDENIVYNIEYKLFDPKRIINDLYCYSKGEVWFSESLMQQVTSGKKYSYLKNFEITIEGNPKLFYLVNPKENMVWYNIERNYRNLVKVVQERHKNK